MSLGENFNLEGFLRLNSQDFNEGINDAEQETEEFGTQTAQTADKVERNLGERFSAVGESVRNTGLAMSATITPALGAIGLSSVQAASKAEEAEARFNSVFDETGDRVETFSDEFAEKIGRSELAIENMAANFGSILNPMTDSEDKAADLSVEFTKLTQDLASFENRDPAQVQRDLQSALAGSSETMQKYGVSLDVARVEQELLNMGIKGGREEATRAQEAQARLNAIVEDTQSAQGNAAETSESFANQQRALRGRIRDLRVEFGEQLLPVAKEVLDVFSGFSERLTGLSDSTQRTIAIVGGLAAALGPVLAILGQLAISIGGLVGPLGSLVGTFGGLTTVGTALAGVLGTVATALGLPFAAVAVAAGALVAAIGGLVFIFRDELLTILQTVTGFILDEVVPAVVGVAEDAIPALIDAGGMTVDILGDVVEALEPVGELAADVGERAADLAADIADTLEPAVSDIVEMLEVWAGVFTDDILPVIQDAIDVASGLANTLANTLEPAVGPVVGALETLVGVIESAVLTAFEGIQEAIGVVTDLLSGDFEGALNSAKAVAGTAIDAIASAFGELPDIIGGLTGAVTDAIIALFPTSLDELAGVAGTLDDIGTAAIDAIVGAFTSVAGAIAGVFPTSLSAVGSVASDMASIGGSAITAIVGAFTSVAEDVAGLFPTSLSVLGSVASNLTSIGGTAIGKITGAFTPVIGDIAGLFPTSLSDLGDVVTTMSDIGVGVVDAITAGLAEAPDLFFDLVELLEDAVPTASRVADIVSDIGGDIVSAIADAITDAPGAIMSAIEGLINDGIGAINDLAPNLTVELPDNDVGLPGPLPSVDEGSIADTTIIPDDPFPTLDTGGFIESGGRATLHEGERVVPEAQVSDRGGVETTTIEQIVINADSQRGGREAARGLKQELRRQGVR